MYKKFVFVLFVLLLIGTAHASLTDDLVSYYKLNETSGNAVDSLGVKTGISSNITYNQDGILSKSFNFNGTNSKVLIDNNVINWGTNNFAVSFWFKLASNNNFVFLGSQNDGSKGFLIDYGPNCGANKIGAIFVGSGGGICSSLAYDTDWHHIIVDGNASGKYLWIDGAFAGSITSTTGLINPTGSPSVALGTRNTLNDFWFNGNLDEVGFWNRGLTQNERDLLYNSGSGLTYPFSSPEQARVTWSVLDFDSGSHLTGVSADCNVNAMDFTSQNSPVTGAFVDQNTSYSCVFSRAGYTDSSAQTGIVDSNKSVTVYLTDETAPSVGQTVINGFDIYTSFIKGTGIISATYTESGSGLNSCEYTVNNGSTWIAADSNTTHCYASYTIASDSNFTFNMRATDVSGNTGTGTATTQYTGDLTAPTTSFSYEQIAGTTDTNITLSCSDAGSGCKTINFSINNGDWNYYTIGDNPLTIIYSGSGDHNIQYYSTDNSDNNEVTKTSQFPIFSSLNDEQNARVTLTGSSIFNGYTVTSWQWQINGSTITGTTNQTINYSTQSNQDLNVCLTTNNTDTYCQSVFTWDTIEPILIAETTNSSFGFTNNFDINYSLTCYDNFSPITYIISWNDGTNNYELYNDLDINGTTITGTIDLNAGQNATITYQCQDAYNTTTQTTQRFYAMVFRLVNEDTGLQLTSAQIGTDFNIVRVYTFDGNYSFNFKDANSTNVSFFSPTEDLWFEIGYKDTAQTKLNRQINFGLIPDSNVAICVPLFQTLYQQRFVANSAKSIVLQNNVSNCYTIAGTLQFAYDTGYSITTYTIPKPYYLYTFIEGVKTYLALLDGGVPTQYNIDAIIFSRQGFNIDIGQDTVGFLPLKNSLGIYDTNTVQIYYVSSGQDNTKLEMQIIKADGTNVWSYIENFEPNELLVNFYWGGLDINMDEILVLKVTTTKEDGSVTIKNYYFTLYGQGFQNDVSNEWAAIIAVLFFLFGITLVAYDKAIGFFGIVISIVALFFLSMASGAWWVNLLSAGFVIIIGYIFLLSRKGGMIQ